MTTVPTAKSTCFCQTYHLGSGGRSEMAALNIFDYQNNQFANRPIPLHERDGYEVETDFQNYYQQILSDLSQKAPDDLTALGLTAPAITVITTSQGLPRAYKKYPRILHDIDLRFYLDVFTDYTGHHIAPSNATLLSSEEAFATLKNPYGIAPIMPLVDVGMATPDDFDPAKHQTVPNREDGLLAVFIAEGRALNIVHQHEIGLQIRLNRSDEGPLYAVKHRALRTPSGLSPYVKTFCGAKLLVYQNFSTDNKNLPDDFIFVPPDARPLNIATLKWILADELDIRRGITPPPMPEPILADLRQAPFRPNKTLAGLGLNPYQ